MRLLLAILLCGTAFADDGGAPPTGCHEAIGDENAQKLFAALKDLKADDCALEEMKTDTDVMRIEWRKAGTPIPLVEIRPVACGKGDVNGPAFSLTIPPGAAEKCPGAIEKMRQLIATESFGGAVKVTGRARFDWLWIAAGAAVLLGAIGLVIWRRRES
jgi:LPXTG-motif cell wall-anchored protein